MQNQSPPARDAAPGLSRAPPNQDEIRAQLEHILYSHEFPKVGQSAMRPDFIPNVVAELKARNFRPADRARLIADIRKAGLAASDEVEASMLWRPQGSPVLVPR